MTSTEVETKKSKFEVSNTVYNSMKFVVTLLLPAISTLYFTLGTIWGLPAVEQIIGTIAAIATFLGVFMKLSSNAYDDSDAKYDGVIEIINDPNGKKIYSLNLNGDPAEIDQRSDVLFKVSS